MAKTASHSRAVLVTSVNGNCKDPNTKAQAYVNAEKGDTKNADCMNYFGKRAGNSRSGNGVLNPHLTGD
jgi:hypothetical protein